MAENFDAPHSRVEAILQNMLGAENELDYPHSRTEDLLHQILDQGGGGGGTKLYKHTITVRGNTTFVITAISLKSTAFPTNYEALRELADSLACYDADYRQYISDGFGLFQFVAGAFTQVATGTETFSDVVTEL